MIHRVFRTGLFALAASSLLFINSLPVQAAQLLRIDEIGMTVPLPAGFSASPQAGQNGSRVYKITRAGHPNFVLNLTTMPKPQGLTAEQVAQGTMQKLQAAFSQSGTKAKVQRVDSLVGGYKAYGYVFSGVTNAGSTGSMFLSVAEIKGYLFNMTMFLSKSESTDYATTTQKMLDGIRVDGGAAPQAAGAAVQPAANQAPGPVLQNQDMGLYAPFAPGWQQGQSQQAGEYNFVKPDSKCLVKVQIYQGAMDYDARLNMAKQNRQQEKARYPRAAHQVKVVKIAGQRVPIYIEDGVKVPSLGLAHMEKFFISNGDYAATIVALAPKATWKKAQRDFLQWMSGLQMQHIEPSPPEPVIQNNLLVGYYSKGGRAEGSMVSASGMDCDGKGTLSYSTSTYLYKIGISTSEHSGSYTVKGDSVTLNLSSGRHNCVITRRYDDGSIKQFKCGGTTWTHK